MGEKVGVERVTGALEIVCVSRSGDNTVSGPRDVKPDRRGQAAAAGLSRARSAERGVQSGFLQVLADGEVGGIDGETAKPGNGRGVDLEGDRGGFGHAVLTLIGLKRAHVAVDRDHELRY